MVDNVTNSQKNVVTTVTSVLYELIQSFKTEITDLHVVYDEQLSYETAMRKYRSDNNMNDSDPVPFPLLAFKRSVLRHSEDRSPSKRMGRTLVSGNQSNVNAKEFRSVHGEFDFEFLYINTSIQDIEQFEVTYLGQEGISNFTELKVNLPQEYDDGHMPYYVRWENLDDKVFEHDESFNKMIVGRALITGHYLTFRTTNKRILEIQANINNLIDPKNNIESIEIKP